jgi:glycosyltransferase involved in cell wall biosynthesis
MKIFEFTRPEWGIAFKRISAALHQYAPADVEWTDYDSCDLMIVHVVGTGEEEILKRDKPKIIIQHCYFTARPELVDYPAYWEKALLSVSFHDLRKYTDKSISYYGMPWGADPEVFKLQPGIERDITVFTTGHIAQTEGIDLVFEAVTAVKGFMMHTGANFGWSRPTYTYTDYMEDTLLCETLNSAKYVSALRFTEGFELLAIEGLMCGARPIVPENDTYDWYREFGYTVNTKEPIVPQLITIFQQEPRPVSAEEREQIVQRFAWEHIMNGFYSKVKEVV